MESLREQVSQLASSSVAKNDARHNNSSKPSLPPLTTRTGVDIAELQGRLQTSDRAMVQVASNFNCLENASRQSRIDSGHLVDSACRDCTQGPAAVYGTTSAYLYRCHFYGQQQQQRQVNLLQHTAEYFGTPEGGKLTLSGTETLLKSEADIDQAAAKVCIGLHTDCPVLFGRFNNQNFYNEPQYQQHDDNEDAQPLQFPLVDQVLSASINLGDYGEQSLPDDAKLNLMRSLLRAAYEGIYLAAILRQRKTLYLTLVGGGSFGNPISLVVEELQRAHRKWTGHAESKLEECVICLYSEHDGNQVKAALESKQKALSSEW